MTNARLKIITTEDGSHSLFREDLNETYHSFHGAKGESLHVFIQHGIKYVSENLPGKEIIKVFEVGLGTGLNAFLAALAAEELSKSIIYHTLEPIPVPEELYHKLNYGTSDAENRLLQDIHEANWETAVKIRPNFELNKMNTTLESFPDSDDRHDIIFFDAFAPSKQSAIWGLENLQKCHALLEPGGVLVTYCAQGQFKRNLAAAGFEVETLKGAMGKKEMVRGLKK